VRVAPPTPLHRPLAPRSADRPSFGILSTFPPTACGIATFSAALATGLGAAGHTVGVVQIDGGTAGAGRADARVVARIKGSAGDASDAATVLDAFDVAIIQHEYGIYGGTDGDAVVDIVRALDTPALVVAHTVLLEPTPHQRSVLQDVVEAASAVVVMTEAARWRLCDHYDVDRGKVVLIPHGAVMLPPHDSFDRRIDRPQRSLLSWGLLGPGKGIEVAIEALGMLRDLRPGPRYVVAGRTHPKVAELDGEAYRESLVARAREVGVVPMVSFDDTYRDLASLSSLLQATDVVVLPYDSVDQVTSGVLVDAVAAGRPVIATDFPHAVELLSSGAGMVVPRKDPAALAAALRDVLTVPGLADSMAAEARRLAPELSWSSVAEQYAGLAEVVLASAGSAVR